MNRRTRDRKLLALGAAIVAASTVSYGAQHLFFLNSWGAIILLFVVVGVIVATVYTVVFNGPEAFWNMITGRQKATQ